MKAAIAQSIPYVGQALQAVNAFDKLFGPKGAVTTGDVGGIVQHGQSLYSAGQGVSQGIGGMFGGSATPTTMSTMGITPDQFKQIDPSTGQKLLRQATGPGLSGDTIAGLGLSDINEFNAIPSEIRQELLRMLRR
jgi:hypothetical protein